MSTDIIRKYAQFEAGSIGQISHTRIPKYLEEKTIHKFGSSKFIRDLTGPLQDTMDITEEMYDLHFRLPVGEEQIVACQDIQANILRLFKQNDKLWAKFAAALRSFARTESTDPNATAADGLRILEDTIWVPPIHRFFETLDVYSPDRRFTKEVDEYYEESHALIMEIYRWLSAGRFDVQVFTPRTHPGPPSRGCIASVGFRTSG